MQSTATPPFSATQPVECRFPLTAISSAFATLPDPRRRQGSRYPLAAVLTLAVAAILTDNCGTAGAAGQQGAWSARSA